MPLSRSESLAIAEPYYGGSHKAFVDGLTQHSRHQVVTLTDKPHHWRWRMREAPYRFAKQIIARGYPFDRLLASDYMDVATLLGFLPPNLRPKRVIAYFHENQFTYPAESLADRAKDHHLAMTNLASAFAADRVVFNSHWHKDDFFRGARAFVKKMPGPSLTPWIDATEVKSQVVYPGMNLDPIRRASAPTGMLRVLWNHRWEYDKGLNDLMWLMEQMAREAVPVRFVLCGQGARREAIRGELHPVLDHVGYLKSRAEYLSMIASCDLVISTAHHEFFGYAVIEAIHAGCFPLLPARLSYPELIPEHTHEAHLYADLLNLSHRLKEAARSPELVRSGPRPWLKTEHFHWDKLISRYDNL